MKVAILCSGLITEDMDIRENYETWREIFPEADIFLGTWDRPDQRSNEVGFHVYYDEPHPHYHCGKAHIEVTIEMMRKAKEEGRPYHPKDISDISSVSRRRKFHNVKQFLSHIYMYNDFVRDKDYDLVLRVRPDTHIDTQYKKMFLTLMDMVLEHKKPIGFETIDADYKKHALGWNKYTSDASEGLSDWLIAYNPKTFNPDLALQKYADKEIRWAENGWYDTLIRDQDVPQTCMGTCWNGIVTLRSNPNQIASICFSTVGNEHIL